MDLEEGLAEASAEVAGDSASEEALHRGLMLAWEEEVFPGVAISLVALRGFLFGRAMPEHPWRIRRGSNPTLHR